MYFECGLGWAPLILDLSLKIEAILMQKSEQGDPNAIEIFAVQAKEKYGMLRFYVSQETDEIFELVHEAEAASSQTCEECGSVGKMRSKRRWIQVLFDKCFNNPEEKNARRKNAC
jgi:hypothetical protein